MTEVAVRLEATNRLSIYGEAMRRCAVDLATLVHTASDLWRG
jgi:hypothetical protein